MPKAKTKEVKETPKKKGSNWILFAIIIVALTLAIVCYFIIINKPAVTPTPQPDETETQMPSGIVKQISMMEISFIPNIITINTGDTIEWTNNDAFTHIIESDAGLFMSDTLIKGDKFSFTFFDAGEYKYHCAIHPGMRGTIIVK